MSKDELIDLLNAVRAIGVVKFKMGDVEVQFDRVVPAEERSDGTMVLEAAARHLAEVKNQPDGLSEKDQELWYYSSARKTT